MQQKYLISTLMVIACSAISFTANAQEETPPPPCTQEAAKQFDFWLGDWEVRRNSDNKLMGLDTIKKTLNGCVLEQHWRQQTADFQPPGSDEFLRGHSLTVFNALQPWPAWNQVWTDNGGNFFTLAGDFKDGKMQLESTAYARIKNRWVWVPKDDGTIHNYGFYSNDFGVTWTKYFDITYYPVGENGPE